MVRFLINYTLEVTDRSQHPVYLSTLGVFVSIPVVASSLAFGALIDVAGFETVFLIVLCFILLGFATTFRLEEPRNSVVRRPDFS